MIIFPSTNADSIVATNGRPSPPATCALVDALANADSTECLPGIAADTLVVHRPNPLLPVEHSRCIAETIPGAHLEVVEEIDWQYPIAEDELRSQISSGRSPSLRTRLTSATSNTSS